jgi:hypothetical protein
VIVLAVLFAVTALPSPTPLPWMKTIATVKSTPVCSALRDDVVPAVMGLIIDDRQIDERTLSALKTQLETHNLNEMEALAEGARSIVASESVSNTESRAAVPANPAFPIFGREQSATPVLPNIDVGFDEASPYVEGARTLAFSQEAEKSFERLAASGITSLVQSCR